MDNINKNLTFASSISSDISFHYWGNYQYYFSTAITLFLIISSFVCSLIEVRLFISKRLRIVISSTTRFYYLIIAVTVNGSMLLNQLPNLFILTNLSFFFPFMRNIDSQLPQITILCDALRMSSVFFPHCIGWFYLLLELITLCKILHPNAIFSKSLCQGNSLKVVLASLVAISGILISIGFVIANHFSKTSMNCMMDLDDFLNQRLLRYYFALDVDIGPYILTLVVSFLLLLIIYIRVRESAPRVTCGNICGRSFPNSASNTKLAEGVVAVMLSLTHFATNFPVGICYCFQVYFVGQSNAVSQALAETFSALHIIWSPFENLDAILDFYSHSCI